MPPDEDVPITPWAVEASASTPGTGFAAIDGTDDFGTGTAVSPDPDLTIGPGHLIAVVNFCF